MEKRYSDQSEGEKLWLTVGWWWLILSGAILGLGWTLIAFALSWYVYNVLLDIVHISRRLMNPLGVLVSGASKRAALTWVVLFKGSTPS